jgi:lysozyme
MLLSAQKAAPTQMGVRYNPGMSNPSQSCLDLIKRSEGLRLTPYLDAAGYWTVGYGHKLTSAELAAGAQTRTITEPDALLLLVDDAEWAAEQVARLVHVPLSQGQLDALTDFTYNLGAERLAGSTLLKLLNLGNYADAGQQLLRWDMAGGVHLAGLTVRRQAELALWEAA